MGKLADLSRILTCALALLCILQSCYKQESTTLEASVQFSNGEVVKNAHVKLIAEPTSSTNQMSIIDDSTTSNAGGLAFFNLDKYYKPGQTGVAVLKVHAFYYGLVGDEIIQIEQEKRNRVVIIVQ